MNSESGTYEISGSSMNLDMGRYAGVIEIRVLTKDKLVFEDPDGTTNCEKSEDMSGKSADSGGLAGRGRQIDSVPF